MLIRMSTGNVACHFASRLYLPGVLDKGPGNSKVTFIY